MHEFIAEIGTSHAGDLVRAKYAIDKAKESGATIAKFQWVIADEIVSSRAGSILLPNGQTNIHAYFSSVERPPWFYEEIKNYAESQNIEFLCSVFGLQSLTFLMRLNPSRIKIASPEINHIPLLQAIARCNVDIILSTGIASCVDVLRALDIIQVNKSRNVTILQCVTQYPAPQESYNMNMLLAYKRLFNCAVGISDHTKEPFMLPAIAGAFGSVMTEKHFVAEKPTLYQNRACPDDPFALSPEKFFEMVHHTKNSAAFYAQYGQSLSYENVVRKYGSDRVRAISHSTSFPVLFKHYFTTRRSVFARTAIAPGQLCTEKNCILLRSEHNINPGISSESYPIIMGKYARIALKAGDPIRLTDVCATSLP